MSYQMFKKKKNPNSWNTPFVSTYHAPGNGNTKIQETQPLPSGNSKPKVLTKRTSFLKSNKVLFPTEEFQLINVEGVKEIEIQNWIIMVAGKIH